MDTDKLIEKFDSYVKILKKYFPDEGIDTFVDDFGTRLVVCPRGLTAQEGGNYGALVDFLSRVAINSKNFSKGVCDERSAVRVSLVHELGKLGCENHDLFLSQESQWHREKLGQNFKYNEECFKMTVSHRTLYLLQKYQISLTSEEWVAILTSQGMHYQENSFYGKSTSKLSSVLHFSRALSEHV